MLARFRFVGICVATFTALAFVPGVALAQETLPLVRAHAHNDYLHTRPLLDALEKGFCSVEADIWLVDGQLLVAHERSNTQPGVTLQRLYLDPLRARAEANGGRVYPGGPEVILLIDIKGPGPPAYAVLRQVLENYKDIITTFTNKGMAQRAVRVIVSGSRPRALMAKEKEHLAAYDGRLRDLESEASKEFMPLISDSWARTFTWNGEGTLPAEERARLHAIVEQAHKEGRLVRFWAIPHGEAAWEELLRAGVDLINTDDLEGLRRYLVQERWMAFGKLPEGG